MAGPAAGRGGHDREIVGLHGGRIGVEEPPQGGTRFVITLPALND